MTGDKTAVTVRTAVEGFLAPPGAERWRPWRAYAHPVNVLPARRYFST